MLDIGWAELVVIGLVALIVIGPEDLPEMFRQLGRFTAKLRQMSREFSRAMEQAAKDTGVKDVAKDLKVATSAKALGLDAVKDAADKFEKWDPMKSVTKATPTMPARSLVPPTPATPTPATPQTVSANAAETLPDDAAEAADDLAAMADEMVVERVVEPTIHGPATQALFDKQALRAQVLKEQTEKLRAIEAGTYVAPTAAAARTPDITALTEVAPYAQPDPLPDRVAPLPGKRATKATTKAAPEAVAKAAPKTKAKAAATKASDAVDEAEKTTAKTTARKTRKKADIA